TVRGQGQGAIPRLDQVAGPAHDAVDDRGGGVGDGERVVQTIQGDGARRGDRDRVAAGQCDRGVVEHDTVVQGQTADGSGRERTGSQGQGSGADGCRAAQVQSAAGEAGRAAEGIGCRQIDRARAGQGQVGAADRSVDGEDGAGIGRDDRFTQDQGAAAGDR